MGTDSFSTHVASGFDKKLVSLYSTNFKECCGTYWGNKEDHVLIQGDLGENKPSFSDKETSKVVNTIPPEKIARSVLDLLNIKHRLQNYKTLNIGEFYSSPSVEVIPDFFRPLNMPSNSGINLRLDYHFDLGALFEWASRYPCHIITEKPIPPDLLSRVKGNVTKISIDLGREPAFDKRLIRETASKGIPLELFCSVPSELKEKQLNFIEWGVAELKHPEKKDLDFASEICNNSSYYSSKTILSKDKEYSSKASWKAGREKSREEKVIDSPDFWKEVEYFRIYNKK